MRDAAVVLALLLAGMGVAVAVAPALPSLVRSAQSVAGSGTELVPLGSIPASGQPALAGPTSVAVDENDHVYVADPTLGEVRVFDYSGRQILSFGALQGSGPKKLVAPVDVKLNGPDEVLVTDRKLRTLFVFSRNGAYRGRFIAPSPDWAPLGVAIAPDGMIYVSDVGDPSRHMVRVFSQSGMPLFSFGRTAEVSDRAQSPGAFYFPSRVLVDKDSVFVADSDNGRVQVFDRNGVFSRFVLTGGVPRGLALDAKGHLMVTDALGSSVSVYGADGKEIGSLGAARDFKSPNDVATDKDGRVYVADRGSATVQVWGTPEQGSLRGASLAGSIRWPWLLLAVPLLAVLPVVLIRPLEDAEAPDELEGAA